MKAQLQYLLFSLSWAVLALIIACNDVSNTELPQLQTQPVTSITQTSAKSGGYFLPTNQTDILVKGVCWGLEKNPTLDDQFTEDGEGVDPYESILTGLKPETVYHVRAYANNKTGTAYGEDKTFKTLSIGSSGQIIADHTVVDRYDDIPQRWIDSVKKMFVVYPGESHAAALPVALNQLETLDSRFQVITRTSGTPYSYRTNELRFSGATWGDFSNPTGWIYSCGEEDWFTNATGRARIKAGITYCNTNNLQLAAIGFGWCYDDSHSGSISSTVDPVYGCRWYGRSLESPSGSRSWGLDAEDQAITGNVVSLDTYLAATQEYIDYCLAQGYRTKVYFTTGPVEPTYYKGEAGYQASLKHQRIRDYVNADPTRILFDYADILCYDNGSTVMATSTWNGHTFPVITPTNYGAGDLGHIDAIGALRLAKAMWWMLARIAGWDGN
ncbi:MAG TPA: hypothetical protein PKJ08_07830 [Candidatus Cloacimonadota bacterium]|nr:hypothetical protein [Candidatus Cloacimonadota bacterium]HQK69366.1 hypothetical protein [Bacteroidales bacterium]